jgi:methyl-accepting chemotaxis protein
MGLFATISIVVEQQGGATNEIARDIQQAAKGTGEVSANITGVTNAACATGRPRYCGFSPNDR